MLQLALHILDIVENSTRAGAGLIMIDITEDPGRDLLAIEIADDGQGMDEETLRKALDPFYTTKGVRRVGLGLPMLRQAALQCDGHFWIESEKGRGTKVRAEFRRGHIDRQPLGDLAGALVTLITGNPKVDFVYIHRISDRIFTFDTREIRQEMEDVPIDHPEVLKFIRSSIGEGLDEIGVQRSE